MSKVKSKDYVVVSDDEETKFRDSLREHGASYADTFEIEEYEKEATVFLKDILGLDYNECFISDESSLYDFTGAGDFKLPDEFEREDWERQVQEKIYLRFGIRVVRNIPIILLCKMIRKTASIVGSGLN